MGCKVKAICPKCRKNYNTVLPWEWKGRGILRKNCPPCQKDGSQRGIKEMPLRIVNIGSLR